MTVEYFSIDGAPGIYFRCPEYDATISTDACARMYLAQKSKTGIHERCVGCRIGAEHAGDLLPTAPDLLDSLVCPRCQRTTNRIVRGLCVSCLNRQYEAIRGFNAKGKPPVRLPKLFAARLRFSTGAGAPTSIGVTEFSVNRLELIYRILRSHHHVPAFGWCAQKSQLKVVGARQSSVEVV